MTDKDIKFFNEYKHLDKLCGEIFSCQSGVNEYISQLEADTIRMQESKSWRDDYDFLKPTLL